MVNVCEPKAEKDGVDGDDAVDDISEAPDVVGEDDDDMEAPKFPPIRYWYKKMLRGPPSDTGAPIALHAIYRRNRQLMKIWINWIFCLK